MTYHGAITLNAWIEIVVIGLLIGTVFNLLGFIATSWAIPDTGDIQIDYEGLGLWRYCLKDNRTQELICTNLAGHSDLPGWFYAVQTLICIAFILHVLSFSSILMYACAQLCHQRRGVLVFSILTNYSGVLLDLIGVSIFGTETPDATIFRPTPAPDAAAGIQPTPVPPDESTITGFKLSWCFILYTIAMVVFAFVGILVVFELLTLPTNPYREEDFASDTHSVGGQITGDGAFPGGQEDGIVQELVMDDPGIKSLSLA